VRRAYAKPEGRGDSRTGVLDLPPRRVLPGCDRPRERGAAPSTAGPPAVGGPTTSGSVRPDLLGLAVPRVGELAVQSRHRATATVLAGYRQGFRLYWRWKSRPNPVGRPRLDVELRGLIRRMVRENPTWGRRRIRAELALLGYEVAELTVANYMHRTSPQPSATWRAFLTAHDSGRSAVTTSLSRPARASLALRPVDSQTHPWWADVPRASESRSPSLPPRSLLGSTDTSPGRTFTCKWHGAFLLRSA
jgi:hypothetical protein